MPRIAAALVLLALGAALGSGCGSSSEQGSTADGTERSSTAPVGATARTCEADAVDAESLRVTGVSCQTGRRVIVGWQRAESCAPPAGGSRTACDSGPYRCAGVRSGRGLAVSCSRPGRSVAFISRRR